MPSERQSQPAAKPASNGDAADRETIARLTSDVLPTLMERLSRSELGELEVREQGWRIRLRRPTETNGHAPAGGLPGAASSASTRPSSASQHAAGAAQREPRRDVVPSPAVGYFSPREGIKAGSDLRAGDGIGHVDVLGVKVEVVVAVDGRLARLVVEPGEAVEYGQPIAHLEPAAASRTKDV